MKQTYSFGALRSPETRLAAAQIHVAATTPIPATLDLRPQLMGIRDQGNQGACVAFAATAIIEFLARKDNNAHIYMAPQFVYNCRSFNTEGMTPADAESILQNLGVPLERTYPYGKVEAKSQIPAAVFKEAAGWRIESGLRVLTMDAAKSALVTNGPCLVTFPAYNYSGRFWHQNVEDLLLGGHAVAVVGYTNTGFIIRNSWGASWNGCGYTEYPFGDWGCHWEMWTYADSPPHPRVNDDPPAPRGCCSKCVLI